MERKSVVGLILCVVLFALGFFLQGNIGLYFNLAGILIVVGGTFGATMIGFRVNRLKILYQVLRGCYRSRVKEPHEIVEILVDLSVKRRLRGLLSLQEDEDQTSILFLRRALGFIIDGYRAQQIKEILATEMYFFKVRRYESERVLGAIAEMCPAFGLVGSVVGLIGMLAGLEDQSIFLKTLPIALTSTLYGVVFANFLLLPLASKIREHTDRELLLQKIIMQGAIAVATELHPRVLEMKLKSFLTPSLRKGRLVSLKRIQEKFKIKAEATPGRPSTGAAVGH